MKIYLAMTFFDADMEVDWYEGCLQLSSYYPWMVGGRWAISSFGLTERLRRAITVLTEFERLDLLRGSDRIADLGIWKRCELTRKTECIDCIFLRPLETPILGPRHPHHIPELYEGLPLEV